MAGVAIGNFDGVHLGHRALVARAAEAAGPTAVLTFEPHPRALFRKDDPPFRLGTVASRRRRMAEQGVDLLIEQTFDDGFASLEAEAFADLLAETLRPRLVVVGEGFRFGRGRKGDAALLARRLGDDAQLVVLEPVLDRQGLMVSSSRVRDALRDGAPDQAAALLGAPWEIEGAVFEGDRRGRQLGYPTANVKMDGLLRPRSGVYAVRCAVDDGSAPVWIDGVANIGDRPTVAGTDYRLEAHLFDFGGDLYGRVLRTQVVAFLRDEKKFAGLDALRAQIATDAAEARARLSPDVSY